VLLLGTTDTLYEGDPSAVAPEVDDEAFLLDAASRFLPEEMLGQVRASYAGLRVLPPGGGTTAEASREHIVVVDPGGMVSVGGGKLTTHRLIALDVLRRLPASVRPRKLSPSLEPLPGASAPDLQALRANLDEPVVEHLVRLYGGEAGNLLRYAAHPDVLEKVHPDAPDIWAQAYYAADEEWALTVEDIVRRRTTLGICGAATSEVRDRVASILSRDNSLLSAGP
jgi:glycerol-3-phosphate dehydrogenase